LGSKSFAKTIRDLAREIEHACALLGVEILPPGNVPLGEHERVTFGKRMNVEDGQRPVVFADSIGRRPARDDFAKHARITRLVDHRLTPSQSDACRESIGGPSPSRGSPALRKPFRRESE